jgi:hypothetical protein
VKAGGWAAAGAILVGAAAAIAQVQPALAARLHRVQGDRDAYVLPPPAELRAMTLGYTAAAVDLLWAKLLVEYGIHHAEKRAFPDLESYLDGILTLEPDYRNVFTYADTLLVYRPPRGYERDARTARRVLEQGIAARPYDGETWLRYGDFLAFVAPSFLPDEAEIAEWRKRGAEALLRANELGAGANRAMTAAALLGRAGQRDAAIRQLEKSYAMTDDPDERARIERELGKLQASREGERVAAAMHAFEQRWAAELPFVSRTTFLLLGPQVDAAACAGPAKAHDPACSRSWSVVLGEE